MRYFLGWLGVAGFWLGAFWGCSKAHMPKGASYKASPPGAEAMKMAEMQPAPGLLPIQMVPADFNTEAYDRIYENAFLAAAENPLSTFSIDVDTASYSVVRRFLNQGQLPPKDAVRIEELVNYFTYDYPPPQGDVPFAAHVEVAPCPWNPQHRLARIALKGREIDRGQRPAANLVFLLDVSGSMNAPNKLPLLKSAMRMLVQQLEAPDRVAIVVYAGASGLVLPSVPCSDKGRILEALDSLSAGGSTNAGSGIQLAYATVREHFLPKGVNRVILCTDGDFNVGITNQGDLVRLIEEQAKGGACLSVLGFGMGNYKDSNLEKLADKGNGNYGYIDTIQEARKLLVEQLSGTLVTIAKDVKIQVEFNPLRVGAYRLVGYENRTLRAEDFRDEKKDAGDIGAGHTVTALYELAPPGKEGNLPKVDPLKYQKPLAPSEAVRSEEIFTLKLAFKRPDHEQSEYLTFGIADPAKQLRQAGPDFQFAAAVACFGMLLRESEHKGQSTFDLCLELAQAGKGQDASGYRSEFIQLVSLAKTLGKR